METILIFATVLGGIAALWYFVDKAKEQNSIHNAILIFIWKANDKWLKLKNKILKTEKLSLVDSFPRNNVPIHKRDIKNVFLKFNKPIDFESTKYIANYYFKKNTMCQWNTGGWVQMAENDTKIIWHVNDIDFNNNNYFEPDNINYHSFEIHVGRNNGGWRVKSKDGEFFPFTKIKVKINDSDGNKVVGGAYQDNEL